MRVGTICYATEQGLGRLAKDFYDNGIISDVLVFKHPDGTPTQRDWYPRAPILTKRPFAGMKVTSFLNQIDVLLVFETPFDWQHLKRCRGHGVKTALVPMYEWSLTKPPYTFDKVISPSKLDVDYFPGSEFLHIPFRTDVWQQRTKARRFLHNGGHLGCRGHKGTLEVLQAVQHLQTPLQLTIRSQEAEGLKKLVDMVPGVENDPRVTIEYGERPYESLWDDHDVLVAPEKFNGLSLPLQEAYAAGMLVITTDRYPTNTWLPKEPLIPVTNYQRAQTKPGHLAFDEAIVDPRDVAATMDAWYDRDITGHSLLGQAYAEANSWEVLKPRYLEALYKLVPRGKRTPPPQRVATPLRTRRRGPGAVVLGTLCLNEMEWLPKLYEQHKDWPDMANWVFVEAADRVYAKANPEMVSAQGLSVDGTSEFLRELAAQDSRVTYIPHGFTGHRDPAQGKCEARQRYLTAADEHRPEFVVVVDADEFYPRAVQSAMLEIMRDDGNKDGYVFRHRDVWRPASIVDQPLFQYQVTGGFWDIPYCRCWRWYHGLTYRRNHNTPERGSTSLDKRMLRLEDRATAPEFIHLGFAAHARSRAAKHRYYVARGEGGRRDKKRSWYVESRAAFETWQPGDALPHGGRISRYVGIVPEVFQ